MRRSLKLYEYHRANAAIRIKIVLLLKGIPFERESVNVEGSSNESTTLKRLNPQGMVPILVDETLSIVQSYAIAEYLEERFPLPSLLPRDPSDRSRVRSLALMVACDGQPLVNLRVRNYLTEKCGFTERAMESWVRHWMRLSLAEYEAAVALNPFTGVFSHGNEPSLADTFLFPHVLLAERFGILKADFPNVNRIFTNCARLHPFAKAAAEYVAA